MKTDLKCFLVVGALVFYTADAMAQTCSGSITETTPSADFTDHNDGTVTHNMTGLMWMKCPLGTTWSGTECTGFSPTTVTWSSATSTARATSFAGYDDWRIPSAAELMSLVEFSCTSPSLNISIFASEYAGLHGIHWTSTPRTEEAIDHTGLEDAGFPLGPVYRFNFGFTSTPLEVSYDVDTGTAQLFLVRP